MQKTAADIGEKRGDGIYYLGDKKWADYEVAVRLSFPEPAMSTSEFSVQMRLPEYSNVFKKC